MNTDWIGVDLDKTLAEYEHGLYPAIGKPIPLMVNRVKQWLSEGKDIRIFTARVSWENGDEQSLKNAEESTIAIAKWCQEYIGQILPITNAKDRYMIELWDDRAVQVIPNTGIAIRDLLKLLEGK